MKERHMKPDRTKLPSNIVTVPKMLSNTMAALAISVMWVSAAAADIVGNWHLDEGKGLQVWDSSGNAGHGKIVATSANPPTWTTRRFDTAALEIRGGGFVEVPDSAVLKPKVLTAEAWIKGTGAAGVDRYILSKGAKGCAMASYAIYTGDGSGLTFYISNGESFVTSPDAGKRVWDNKWHHVAGTYDGRAVKLYLDGRQVAGNKPTTLAINYDLPTDNKFYIGFTADVVSVFSEPSTT
jgi:hypothetical protein